MSQTRVGGHDIDRAQADLLLRRGLVDPASIQRAAQRSPGEEDLCAVLLRRGELSAADARAVRGEALAALDLSGESSPPGYVILEKLGQGAMGFVARARHSETGRVLALKTILSSGDRGPDDDELRRFQREARTLILLKHPCLVEVFDVSMSERAVFLAMELIDGQDLRANVEDVMRREGAPPSWEQVDWVFRDLADALAYCHSQGVIHRDVKPQNIVLDADKDRAVLIDFGLIKHEKADGAGRSLSLSLTAEGAMVGTPAFMSPEQLFPGGDYGPLTAASDVWGFGATLFYTLTGRAPYGGGSTVEIAMRMREGPAPDLRELSPTAPARVAELCAACLERRAERRPSAARLTETLARPPARPRRWWPPALLAALLLALALAYAARRSSTRAAPARIAYPAARGSIYVLGEDGFLEGEVSGAPPAVTFGGQHASVENGRLRLKASALPSSGVGRVMVPAAFENGAWRSRELTVWSARGLDRAREMLADHGRWRAASAPFRRAISELVARELGDEFRALGLAGFPAEAPVYEIARFEHRASGQVFHLIPGGPVSLVLFSDNDEYFVWSLRVLIWRAKFGELAELHNNWMKRARVYFADEFQAALREFSASSSTEDTAALLAFVNEADLEEPVTDARTAAAARRYFALVAARVAARHQLKVERRAKPFLLAATELSAHQWARLRGEEARGPDLALAEVGFEAVSELAAQSGLRLPTREEWLHAQAGGAQTRFFWGDDPARGLEFCWLYDNQNKEGGVLRRPVSLHATKTNAFGLSDMLGNLSEWAVEDWSRWVDEARGVLADLNLDRSGRRLGRHPTETDRPSDRRRRQAILGGDFSYDVEDLQIGPTYFRALTDEGEPMASEKNGFRLALDLPRLLR